MQVAARPADDSRNETVSRQPDYLEQQTHDALRLLGLSRIPRCAGCPRLRALEAALLGGGRLVGPWPPAPRTCEHQVCAPMVRRFAGFAPRARAADKLED